MPMAWNTESNSKLLMGIMNQVRKNSIKIDYPELATYMGNGCSTNALRSYLGRVGRTVEGSDMNLKAATSNNNDNKSPEKTPKKGSRGRGRPQGSRTPKKRKLAETDFKEDPDTEHEHEHDDVQVVVKTETEIEQLQAKVELEPEVKNEVQDQVKAEITDDVLLNIDHVQPADSSELYQSLLEVDPFVDLTSSGGANVEFPVV